MRSPIFSALRRLVPVLLAAALVISFTTPATAAEPRAASTATPASAAVKSGVKVGAFRYDLDTAERTATLTGWSGKRKKTITIPAKIIVGKTTYPVTAIGYGAFAGPVGYVFPDYSPVPATKVSIPKGVERIEDYAFYGNRIPSFTIPASVTWIGVRALDQDRFTDTGGAQHPLRKVTFRGDAPAMAELGNYILSPGGSGYNGLAPFGIGNGLIVYYPPTAKGFTKPIWAGYLAAPVGTAPVPTGYGAHVKDLAVALDRTPVAGAKLTASLRAWAVGGKLSPKPTKLTYQWQLQQDDGTWKRIGTGKTVTLPKGSTGKMLRIVTIANGPGKRKAVLQLKGVRLVLDTFDRTATPKITLPQGVKKATVGTKLTAEGATAGKWKPKADTVAYQWFRNGKAITKGTKRAYTVTSADLGKKLTVRATAQKQDYRQASRTSNALSVPKKK